MQIGIIGVGMVGGTLNKWFKEHTYHSIKLYDPYIGYKDDLKNSDAVFICVPVPATDYGQDLTHIYKSLSLARESSDRIFIKSTVLPGTNDSMLTTAMPEFLTARHAYQDMCNLPILVGNTHIEFVSNMFTDKDGNTKKIIQVTNKEAELAKFTHNCYGALKVTYFNFIYKLAEFYELDYKKVLEASQLTGFIEKQHTQVPGHDGLFGYGGTCFPENMKALNGHLKIINDHHGIKHKFLDEEQFIKFIRNINETYRNKEV